MAFRSFAPPQFNGVSAVYSREQLKKGLYVKNYKRRLSEDYLEETELFYPEKPPRRKRPKLAYRRPANKGIPCEGAHTSILDLPDGLLMLILESALRGSWDEKKEAERQRMVCSRWRKAINGCVKAVKQHRIETDILGSLQALKAFTSVTHVHLGFFGRPDEEFLLQGLATGLPQITSFSFFFGVGGWDALPGLHYFLSHRTSLQELSLYISGLRNKDSSDKYIDEDSEHFALLEQMDFSSLVHLKTLTLKYNIQCSPGSRVCMPWSRSILGLPRLEALHVELHEVGQVRHLPRWLAELRAFASLSFFCQFIDSFRALPCCDALRHLQELVLVKNYCSMSPETLATVARLQALTSLQVLTSAQHREFHPGCATASGLLLPGAKRLHLAVEELPAVRSPLPLLGDLWLRVSEQAHVQPNLFAFTPALRVLHLELVSAASWPNFRYLPAQLTSLTLRLSVKAEGDSTRVVDIGHLSALEKLHLTCGVLPAVPGFRFFKRYRQYAGDAHLCRFLPLAVARELFPDARPPPPADPEEGATIQQQEEEQEGSPQHTCAPPLALAGPTTRSQARRQLAARLQSGSSKRAREEEEGTAAVPARKRACNGSGSVSRECAVPRLQQLAHPADQAGQAGVAGGGRWRAAPPGATRTSHDCGDGKIVTEWNSTHNSRWEPRAPPVLVLELDGGLDEQLWGAGGAAPAGAPLTLCASLLGTPLLAALPLPGTGPAGHAPPDGSSTCSSDSLQYAMPQAGRQAGGQAGSKAGRSLGGQRHKRRRQRRLSHALPMPENEHLGRAGVVGALLSGTRPRACCSTAMAAMARVLLLLLLFFLKSSASGEATSDSAGAGLLLEGPSNFSHGQAICPARTAAAPRLGRGGKILLLPPQPSPGKGLERLEARQGYLQSCAVAVAIARESRPHVEERSSELQDSGAGGGGGGVGDEVAGGAGVGARPGAEGGPVMWHVPEYFGVAVPEGGEGGAGQAAVSAVGSVGQTGANAAQGPQCPGMGCLRRRPFVKGGAAHAQTGALGVPNATSARHDDLLPEDLSPEDAGSDNTRPLPPGVSHPITQQGRGGQGGKGPQLAEQEESQGSAGGQGRRGGGLILAAVRMGLPPAVALAVAVVVVNRAPLVLLVVASREETQGRVRMEEPATAAAEQLQGRQQRGLGWGDDGARELCWGEAQIDAVRECDKLHVRGKWRGCRMLHLLTLTLRCHAL
eukprot:jgi/Mesen1/8914/ME000548S08426